MDARRTQYPDGRWHFQHGPIDIVIGASGNALAIEEAHEKAWFRFRGILGELVQELPNLRRPVQGPCLLRGAIARRMWQACQPYKKTFITPMAAVAGSVAQEVIACYAAAGVTRAWANNGGDIALHLAASQSVQIGLFANMAQLDHNEVRDGVRIDGQFQVSSLLPVRGVATSGWRGRSFSLGIADSVTVLARTASEADAAATVIANAVDVDDVRVIRRPASELKDDSDLGLVPVTVDVPWLEPALVQQALQSGLRRAQTLRAAGLIWSAALICQNQIVSTDTATVAALENRRSGQQAGSVFA